MTDAELIKEFISVERNASEIRLQVRTIDWGGRPYDPVSKWKDASTLPATASEMDIQSASLRILDDPAFFRICTECNERNPNGWMHDDKICQACAERNHGVCY